MIFLKNIKTYSDCPNVKQIEADDLLYSYSGTFAAKLTILLYYAKLVEYTKILHPAKVSNNPVFVCYSILDKLKKEK